MTEYPRSKQKQKGLTLDDFEIRYANIRRNDTKRENCTVAGCKNPRDSTRFGGKSTCCAYHRLLFDFWSCELPHGKPLLEYSQRGRRIAFSRWLKSAGKEDCDAIVLKMAHEPINWDC
jgi:hypothetical protein